MRDTRISRRYVLVYTAACVLLGCAVFFPFLTAGKSLVGNGDGQSQYILQLRYMGEWLRESAGRLLHGRFDLRTYDFTIGMGDDINAVIRFHPLDYLSVFVPAAYTEQLYAFLILLRMYLAGLSFSLYAFYWKKTGTQVLAGTLTYLFCGYVFELGIVHPIYVAPLIVMPLLLLGAEYMMEEKRRHSFVLFSVMVYLGFTSNYYFMYINSVALLVYVLIRFFAGGARGPAVQKDSKVRSLFLLAVRMICAYVTGLMLSCVTLLPTLSRYLNSYRSANLSDSGNLLFYEDLRRYFAWTINLITPLVASGNGTHLNFSVVVLPAVVLLVLAGKGKWRSMKWILLSLLLFLLLPFGGYVMAVMHTENNRWVYLISLALSMCVTLTADSFLEIGKVRRRALLAVCVVFDAAVAALSILYPFNVYHAAAAVQLTVFTAILLAAPGRIRAGKSAALVLGMTVVSTVLNGYFTFGGRFGNLTRYYADRGTTQTFFSESAYANYAKAVPSENGNAWKDGFYRVDGVWNGSTEDNASLQLGYPGVQIYNSVLNASQVGYLIDTQNIGLTTMLHIHSLDGRTGQEAAAGVRYFQTGAKKKRQVPYGFRKEVWTDGEMSVWENEFPLNFGYTTDQIVSHESLAGLSGVGIEEVMLSAACLKEKEAGKLLSGEGFREADVSDLVSGIRSEELPLPEGGGGILRTKDGYRVKKKEALKIPFRSLAGYDVLVGFSGLKPDGFGAAMRVKASGISKKVTLLSEKQTYTMGREDYLVSLGYAEKDSEDTLKIRFTKKGAYALKGITIYYVPREGYAGRIEALNENSLQDVSFSPDTVTGSIRLEKPRYMVFQIPWSKGWSAQVDGKEAPLLQTNECYMGLALAEGDHEICLSYRTPWGREGLLVSLAGLFLLAGGYTVFRRRFQRSLRRIE